MRITVEIDNRLMTSALKSGGYRTKKATVEAGLLLLIQMNSQQRLRRLRGKIAWSADLDAMRKD